jgi:hypothetical protein
MPEGVGYGPQDTASTGKNLNTIGQHCYAYSGKVNSTGSQSSATDPLISFTTGSFYTKIILSWGNEQTSGTADNFVKVTMNGISMYEILYKEGADSNESNPKNLYLIIPPYTTFEALVGTSASAVGWTLVLMGEIYGKIN